MSCRIVMPLALLAVLVGLAACSGQETLVPADALVITNGSIIDGTGADPIQDGILIIQDGRIVGVGAAADYTLSPGATIIDANGGTILPGIIDAHVHGAADPGVRRQFLVKGVTSVCDLGSPLDSMPLFEQEEDEGGGLAARGFKAGPILTVPGGLPDAILQGNQSLEVATAEEARAAVAELVGRGADAIKLYLEPTVGGQPYPMLDREQVEAIVEAAHARGVQVRAHVTNVSVWEMVLEAGVDTIEHIPYPRFSQAEQQIHLASNDLKAMMREHPVPEYGLLLPLMAERDVVMVPTLVAGPVGSVSRALHTTPAQQVYAEALLETVGRFRDAGGIVALGSDYGVPGVTLGAPLAEMEWLLAAGLSPMEVIKAGTRNAAKACGQGDELGTLETGKLADLIVVDGDPLADIAVMRRVVLVVKGGEVATMPLDRAALWGGPSE